MNPYLPGRRLSEVLGTSTQDIDTENLYKEVCEKYDVYHIAITNDSCYERYKNEINNSWGKLLNQHLIIATSDELPKIISEIVTEHENNFSDNTVTVTEEGISW